MELCPISLPFPVAAIKSQRVIASNNEDEILKSLVSEGPVSIGICGTDPMFMYYSGGILDFSSCCRTQNHAILIVGYGMLAMGHVRYMGYKEL